jgi:hypothetical protein
VSCSAWDEIFTMALPVFIINPAAKGCVITASANFCEKARAEPSLLELYRAEQISMKVIYRGKARQQGWAQSFCARRNEEIAEAVAGVARFAEKYGVAVIFFDSFFHVKTPK